MKTRDFLGITQEQMAVILGISKSLLSMYELGKRDLPTHALVKLAALSNHVNNTINKRKSSGVDKKTYSVKSVIIINELITEYQLKLLKLERKLRKIEKDDQKAFAAFQVSLYEQANNKQINNFNIQRMKRQAERKLEMNNWQKQLACQYEIMALKATIDALITQKDKL